MGPIAVAGRPLLSALLSHCLIFNAMVGQSFSVANQPLAANSRHTRTSTTSQRMDGSRARNAFSATLPVAVAREREQSRGRLVNRYYQNRKEEIWLGSY